MRYKYKVSIIVPCYNILPWLDQCLQSLVSQSLQQIEIIAINDGSTDGTSKRLDAWQTKYPDKIKVVHKSNGGLASARNSGIKLSQGEFITFVDADDWVDVTMMQKLYETIVLNNSDYVRCNYISYYQNTKKIKVNSNIKKVKNLNMQKISDIKLALETMKNSCCVLFNKSFLTYNNIKFIEGIFLYEDVPFILNVLLKSSSITIIEDALYYYRLKRPNQLTAINDERLFLSFIVSAYVRKTILHSSNSLIVKLLNTNKLNRITNVILRDDINSSAYITTIIEKRLLLNYLNNAAYRIFKYHSLFDIYKIAIKMTFTKDLRYLPFVILLNTFFLGKKKNIPNHPWIQKAENFLLKDTL